MLDVAFGSLSGVLPLRVDVGRRTALLTTTTAVQRLVYLLVPHEFTELNTCDARRKGPRPLSKPSTIVQVAATLLRGTLMRPPCEFYKSYLVEVSRESRDQSHRVRVSCDFRRISIHGNLSLRFGFDIGFGLRFISKGMRLL